VPEGISRTYFHLLNDTRAATLACQIIAFCTSKNVLPDFSAREEASSCYLT